MLRTPPDAPERQHRLTPAGYRAIGLTSPPVAGATSRPNKKALVLTLLSRDEGATLSASAPIGSSRPRWD